MKNFVQPGKVVELAAPADVSSGDGVLIGSLFGVAALDALSGAQVNVQLEGVFSLPKLTTDDMVVGEKVNWNDSNSELQEATSDLDNVGTVIKAAGNGILVVEVILTPV